MIIEQNISRLQYLISLYKISIDELLDYINEGLKKNITKEDILKEKIELNYLKRIDKLFKKGLHFYLDPKALETSKEASIFFRKQSFNSELNIGAKKIVNHFEDFKISLSGIAKLADLNIKRVFPLYTLADNPSEVAKQLRQDLYPDFTNNLREFLKQLIDKFAKNNILVFEFVETWNKREKANIDGFFLEPNVIVLKRQQEYFRREIFTLLHELGHFLLNEEEIEKLDFKYPTQGHLSSKEKWCNDFAFYFLAGNYLKELEPIKDASPQNDYFIELVEYLSKKTNLSRPAIYTHLLFQNRITRPNYDKILGIFEKEYREIKKEKERQKERRKELGIQSEGRAPKPIESPLLISTIQTAFYEGVIDEYEVCKRLKIKPEKMGEYIS